MKSILTRSLSAGLLFVITCFWGCHDGAPGPAGTAGTNGATGANGTGYDEAVKKGNIIVYLDGTLPNGNPFKDTLDFKFSNSDVANNSYMYPWADNDLTFTVKRFNALVNTSWDDNAQFYFEPYQYMGDTTWYFELDVKADIGLPDFTHIKFNDYYYNTEGSNLNAFEFTGFTYDPSTGRVRFKYDFDVPANSNVTGNTLRVSGEVNCLVYQYEGD